MPAGRVHGTGQGRGLRSYHSDQEHLARLPLALRVIALQEFPADLRRWPDSAVIFTGLASCA